MSTVPIPARPPAPIVVDAIEALSAFRTTSRYELELLLRMWCRADQLTPTEFATVLDHFGGAR